MEHDIYSTPAYRTIEEKIYLIERMTAELNSLILTAAMENARMGSESKVISENIEQLKFINDLQLLSVIDQFKNNPNESIWAEGGDPNGITKQIKGVIKDVILDLIEMWAALLEKMSLLTLKESMQIKAKPLSLCIEEIRKTTLKIRTTAKPDSLNHRRIWNGREIELAEKPIISQRSEFLSFDIGGKEFAEEFVSVKEILGYNDYIKQIGQQLNNKTIKITDWLSVDYYVDLYKLYDLKEPRDKSDMQIIVINYQTYEYESKPYTVSQLISVAFPVDFINYPFSSKAGKPAKIEPSEKMNQIIKESWNWIKKYCSEVSSVDKVEREPIHFIDWPKIISEINT